MAVHIKLLSKIRRVLAMILAGCTAMTLTGCWGINELNEIGLVTNLGIDAAEDGRIQVTALVNMPSAGPMTQTGTKSNVWVGMETGQSIDAAIQRLRNTASRRLVLYHTRTVIIGEDIAKEGIKEVVDYLSRSRETRFSIKLLIAEGSAYDILTTPADVQQSLPQEIDGLITNTEDTARSYIFDAKDYLSRVSNKGAATLLGKVKQQTSKHNTYSTNQQDVKKDAQTDQEITHLEMNGSSVMKEDHFIGFLEELETRGCLWMMNKVKKGSVTAERDGVKVILDYRKAKTEITPKIQDDGKLSVQVKTDVRGGLAGISDGMKVIKKESIAQIQEMLQEEIVTEMQGAIDKLQKEYKTDAIGFCSYFRRKYPKQWHQMEQEWDTLFPTIEVSFEVKVQLRRYGTIAEPVIDSEEQEPLK